MAGYDLEQIKKFLDTGAGLELKKYLTDRINDLKDISNLKDLNKPDELALETKAAIKAYQKMMEIFSTILGWDVEEAEEPDPRDNYHNQ